MSPKYSTCPSTGKRIMSRKNAMREARWWRLARFARMQHYRCTKCNHWHIGNVR